MKYILDIKQRTRYRVLCFLGYSEYIGVSPKISRDFLTFLLTERTRFLRDRGTGTANPFKEFNEHIRSIKKR